MLLVHPRISTATFLLWPPAVAPSASSFSPSLIMTFPSLRTCQTMSSCANLCCSKKRKLKDPVSIIPSLPSSVTRVTEEGSTALRSHLGQSFEKYFSDGSTEDEEVTNPEYHCYKSVFESPITGSRAEEAYHAAPEVQTYHLLIEPAFNMRRRLHDMASYFLYAAIQRRLPSYRLICFFQRQALALSSHRRSF